MRLNVLVACESSGTVREAFNALGHNAWSADLLPADDGSAQHFQMDVVRVLRHTTWDIVIAHPPCTYLCVAGNRWHAGSAEREQAVAWTAELAELMGRRARIGWAIENPVGVLSTQWRKATQYIQPWQFGHGETKKTGLWLEGLDPLTPTNVVEGREQRIWKMGPSPDRWKERSKTYAGVGEAMARQWGGQA